jgi:hypothetical protein
MLAPRRCAAGTPLKGRCDALQGLTPEEYLIAESKPENPSHAWTRSKEVYLRIGAMSKRAASIGAGLPSEN